MGKKYFLQENDKASQPYSLDDLQAKNITADTLVCVKFGDWKLAKDIPEIAEILEWQPPIPSESDWIPPSTQVPPPNLPQAHKGSNKAVIIVVGAILVAVFFIPWITAFVSLSAWDMVFGNAGDMIGSSFRYIAVLIPVAGILIIYGAAFNNENYPLSKSFLFILPILTLLTIGIVIGGELGKGGGRIGSGNDFNEILKVFGIGFWLTVICSVILPFLGQNSSTVAATTLFGEDEEKRLAESRLSTEITTTIENQDRQSQQASQQLEEQLAEEPFVPEPPSRAVNFPQTEPLLQVNTATSDKDEQLESDTAVSRNIISHYKIPLIIASIIIVAGLASYHFIFSKNICDIEGEKFLGTWKNGALKKIEITRNAEMFSCVYGISYSETHLMPPLKPGQGGVTSSGSSGWFKATYEGGFLKRGESVVITYSNGKIIYSGEEYEKVNSADVGTPAFVQTKQGSTLRLRAAPSEQAAIVSNIPNDSALTILRYADEFTTLNGEKGKWCQVNFNGTVGWAWGGFLRVGEKDGQPTMDNSIKLTRAEAKKLIGKQMVKDGIIEQSCFEQEGVGGFEQSVEINNIYLNKNTKQYIVSAAAGLCGEMYNSPCIDYWVYEQKNNYFRLIGTLICTKGDVKTLNTRTNGFHDIRVKFIMGAYGDIIIFKYKYNGKEYKHK